MISKYTIVDAQNIAQKRGGKCLSPEYLGMYTKMLWECSKKHQWEALYAAVRYNKTWCPTCSGSKRNTLEKAQELAISKGGKLLSYLQNIKIIKLRCCGNALKDMNGCHVTMIFNMEKGGVSYVKVIN